MPQLNRSQNQSGNFYPSGIKKCFRYLLIFAVCFTTSFSTWAKSETSRPSSSENQIISEVDTQRLSAEDQTVVSDATTLTKAWAETHASIAEDLNQLYIDVFYEASLKVEEKIGTTDPEYAGLSPEETLRMLVDKDLIQVKAGNGRFQGEMNSAAGIFFVKVIDHKTKLSYLLIEQGLVPPRDSEAFKKFQNHLDRIIAHQHFDAGKSSHVEGRDTVLGWMNFEKKIADLKEFPKLKLFSKDWRQYLRNYRLATVQKTDKGRRQLSIASGAIQGALSLGVSALAHAKHPETDFNWIVPVISVGFGMGIGLNLATYRNYINRPYFDITAEPTRLPNESQFQYRIRTGKEFLESPLAKTKEFLMAPATRRVFKSSQVSAIFACLVLLANRDHNAAITFASVTGGALTLTLNVLANNLGRDNWRNIARYEENLRQNLGTYKPRIFGYQLAPMKKTDVKSQLLIEPIPFLFKMADLYGVSTIPIALSMVGAEMKLPVLLMMSTLLIAVPVNLKLMKSAMEKLSEDPAARNKLTEIQKLYKKTLDGWLLRNIYIAIKDFAQPLLEYAYPEPTTPQVRIDEKKHPDFQNAANLCLLNLSPRSFSSNMPAKMEATQR